MVFFTVFLQGGTIKLFVKLFNIELQTEGKDNKIANDIQDKLMDDVMEGVQNVVGVQRAINIFSKVCSSVDKSLKNVLIHDDCKQELQRRFERICLDEHITNLYAPRIIAKQVSSENRVDGSIKNLSFKDTKKSFRKAVKKSPWETFKTEHYEDPTYARRQMKQQLEKRANRSNTMGTRVLEHLKNRSRESLTVQGDRAPTQVERSRSHSHNSDFGLKISGNAALIKESYHELQGAKKNTNGISLRLANINPAVLVEETETEIEAETALLRQSSV